MVRPTEVDERTWDALKTALLADRVERALEESLPPEITADAGSEPVRALMAGYVRATVRSLTGRDVPNDLEELRETLRALESAAAAVERLGFDLASVVGARSEVAAEAENPQFQRYLSEAVADMWGRTRSLRDSMDENDNSELERLRRNVEELEEEVIQLRAQVSRNFDKARTEFQGDLRTLLGALSMGLDPRLVPSIRYVPVRLFMEPDSDAREAEAVRGLLKLADAVGFQQAAP